MIDREEFDLVYRTELKQSYSYQLNKCRRLLYLKAYSKKEISAHTVKTLREELIIALNEIAVSTDIRNIKHGKCKHDDLEGIFYNSTSKLYYVLGYHSGKGFIDKLTAIHARNRVRRKMKFISSLNKPLSDK